MVDRIYTGSLPMLVRKQSSKKIRIMYQSGQALLIVLLVMAVALSVVLSSVSRSVSDISITEVEESSSRAFSAAEAGIEEALLSPPSGGVGTYTVGDATAEVIVGPQDVTGGGYRYPEKLENGDEAIIWFVDHDNDEKMYCSSGNCATPTQINKLCWGDTSIDYSITPIPAIQITVYYDYTVAGPSWTTGDFSNVKIETKGFDPDGTRRTTNGFSPASEAPGQGCQIGQAFYNYEMSSLGFDSFDFDDACDGQVGCLIMAKIRMLYNNQPEGIAFQIPSMQTPQGIDYDSTGVLGETQRKVEVFKSFAEPLEIFTGAMFSSGSLEKIN